MVQHEPILIFEHTHAQPQFDRHAGFALRDPLRVRLKDREDFLCLRDRLALDHPPPYLVDLAPGMLHKTLNLLELMRRNFPTEIRQRVLNLGEQRAGQIEVGLMR